MYYIYIYACIYIPFIPVDQREQPNQADIRPPPHLLIKSKWPAPP